MVCSVVIVCCLVVSGVPCDVICVCSVICSVVMVWCVVLQWCEVLWCGALYMVWSVVMSSIIVICRSECCGGV